MTFSSRWHIYIIISYMECIIYMCVIVAFVSFFSPSSYIPVSLSLSHLFFSSYYLITMSFPSTLFPYQLVKKSTGCHINDFLYKWRSESRFIFFFSQDETVANWTGCVIVQRITQLDGWQGRKLIQAITYIMATSRGFQSSTSTAGKDGRRLIHQDSLYVSAIPFLWA